MGFLIASNWSFRVSWPPLGEGGDQEPALVVAGVNEQVSLHPSEDQVRRAASGRCHVCFCRLQLWPAHRLHLESPPCDSSTDCEAIVFIDVVKIFFNGCTKTGSRQKAVSLLQDDHTVRSSDKRARGSVRTIDLDRERSVSCFVVVCRNNVTLQNDWTEIPFGRMRETATCVIHSERLFSVAWKRRATCWKNFTILHQFSLHPSGFDIVKHGEGSSSAREGRHGRTVGNSCMKSSFRGNKAVEA